jgi:RNA polymerase sigma-70 factor (ECF subfamily)
MFEDLLRAHQREIYRFACRMTGNTADGSDVLQDTFLRAFRAYRRLPPGANHRAWLYRIAARSAVSHARAARVRRAVPLEHAAALPDHDGDVEAAVESRRLMGALAAALRRLSPRQRIALIQRKYEGLSYAEIASTLDCSEEAARAHVYQAMTKVRAGLTREGSVKRLRAER